MTIQQDPNAAITVQTKDGKTVQVERKALFAALGDVVQGNEQIQLDADANGVARTVTISVGHAQQALLNNDVGQGSAQAAANLPIGQNPSGSMQQGVIPTGPTAQVYGSPPPAQTHEAGQPSTNKIRK